MSGTIFEKAENKLQDNKQKEFNVECFSKTINSKFLRDEDINIAALSENEVVRHYTNLSQKNFSLDGGFYPLGSCTMKYNPKVNEWAAALDGFANIHPAQSDETIHV